MFEALYVERNRPGVADLSWPPSKKHGKRREEKKNKAIIHKIKADVIADVC